MGLKREITFLLYLNVDWDTDRHGGCLRLHPPDRASGAPVDVAVRRWDIAFEDVHFRYQARRAATGEPRSMPCHVALCSVWESQLERDKRSPPCRPAFFPLNPAFINANHL